MNNAILGIYRSPSNRYAELFINSLSAHLATVNSQKNIIIAGDININIAPIESEQSYELKNKSSYLDMLSAYGILPGHTLNTRDTKCLDHFMLRLNNKNHSVFIAIFIDSSITDHYTTFLTVAKVIKKHIAPKTTSRLDQDNALKYLKKINLPQLLACDNPNQITDNLIQMLAESIKENTKTLKIPKTKRILKPWITDGILKCIRNRNNLQKQSREDPLNEIKKITFTRYRNYCNKLIKKLKRQYERQLIQNSINNTKALWKNIKTLTYTSKSKDYNSELTNLKSSTLDSANYINSFFANIGNDLANEMKKSMKDCDI